MREILFRGKNIDNGKWIYGGYVHLHKTTYCYAGSDDGNNDIHRIVFERMTDWNLPNQHMMADVLPETVGQFTGLVDNNGVRIFEGDIVRAFTRFSEIYVSSVAYHDGTFWFKNWSWTKFLFKFEKVEVIGNIHDNPELFETAAKNIAQSGLAPATENFELMEV